MTKKYFPDGGAQIIFQHSKNNKKKSFVIGTMKPKKKKVPKFKHFIRILKRYKNFGLTTLNVTETV